MHRSLRRTVPVTVVLLIALTLGLRDGLEGEPAAAQTAAPTVTQITPTYSAAAGGATVTILGTNFATAAGATQFTDAGGNPYFSGVACSSTTQCSAVSLAQQVDAKSALVIEIVATVGDQIGSDGEQFVWYGQPGLDRLTPSSAKAGTVVTLHGGVFPSSGPYGGPVSIRFGDKPAGAVACPNIDECYGQAPAGSGTVQVTITTPGGTSNGVPFTYPATSAASPPGAPAPGQPATPGVPGIPAIPPIPGLPRFPGIPSIPVVPGVPSVPALPGLPGLPGGSAPPTVTSITPNYGPAAGGTQVTLTGSGFSTTPGATQFAAAQYQLTNVTCASTTRCTAVTPSVAVAAGSAVIADGISVTVNGQMGQNQNLFFVWYGPPQLTSISPTSGPAAGGTTVTLNGGAFPSPGDLPGPVSVRFGATQATNVSCASGGACTATAPAGSGTVQVTISTPGGTSNGVAFSYTSP